MHEVRKMEKLLITVVVPVYKVPETMLRRCLDSIVGQDSSNFETILIDDGSPDQCGLICDEYVAKYKNFSAIHQENSGLAVVRNVGIDNASGQWICFVDGDDWIEPDTISFAKEFIAKYGDADVLIWDEFCYTRSSQRENYFLGRKEEGTITFEGKRKNELFDIMLPEKYKKSNPLVFADIGNCHARVYKVDFLRMNRIYNQPELRRMQDNVFSLWVIEKADKIQYRCRRLYHYSYNEDAATKKYNKNICENLDAVYRYMIDFADQCHPGNLFRQRIYTRFARLFLKMVEQKHANPNNPLSGRQRLAQMKTDFSNPHFQEVIRNIDLNGQAGRVRISIILLRIKAYWILYVLVKAIVFTREIRMKLR